MFISVHSSARAPTRTYRPTLQYQLEKVSTRRGHRAKLQLKFTHITPEIICISTLAFHALRVKRPLSNQIQIKFYLSVKSQQVVSRHFTCITEKRPDKYVFYVFYVFSSVLFCSALLCSAQFCSLLLCCAQFSYPESSESELLWEQLCSSLSQLSCSSLSGAANTYWLPSSGLEVHRRRIESYHIGCTVLHVSPPAVPKTYISLKVCSFLR